MAANTTVNATMMAKDWELVIGLLAVSADEDMQLLQFNLTTAYRALATKPAPTDNVTVVTSERGILRIAEFLYGTTVQYVYRDAAVGAAQINRIMTALRAMNNVADNYLSMQFAIKDDAYAVINSNIRKAGRKALLMFDQYDNN